MADDFSDYSEPQANPAGHSVAQADWLDGALLFPRDYALQDGVLVRGDAAAPAHDYSDGDEVETRIATIIRAADDRGVFSAALRAGMTDWPSRYHLSSRRANLLRPFAGRLAGRRVLEIGAGCGAISRYLGEVAAGPAGGEIVSLESSRRRAGIARLRTEDLPNVQVVCDDLFRFVPEQPFDVVVIVGVLEYARLFLHEAACPEQALLTRLHGFLRPGGLMLLAIENQLGLKYLAGAPEDHCGQPYFGIEDRYGARTAVTFGHRELDRLLQQAGFAARESYLPFPDYKMPTLMISPRGRSHAGFNAGTLVAEAVSPNDDTRFSLQTAWPIVARNGLLADLANSFLIAATAAGPRVPEPDANVLAWHYNTDRGYPFSKETRFVADATTGRISVVRTALFQYPTDFAAPIACQLETEPYLSGETWWFKLIRIMGRRGWTLADVIGWSSIWLDALRARAGGCELLAHELVDGSLVDATPFNLIVRDNEPPVFIDQEWQVKSKLPLGFILARSLRGSICRIVHIARPADPELFSADRIVQAVLAQHGLLLTGSDFERYLELEAMLQAWVTGSVLPAANSAPDETYRRPIQWRIPGGLAWNEAAIEEENRQRAAAIAMERSEVEEERRQHAAAIEEERRQHAAAIAEERLCNAEERLRNAAEIEMIRREIAAANERVELAEKNYHLIRYSISWRLTGPFRRIVGLLPSQLRCRLRRTLKALAGRG